MSPNQKTGHTYVTEQLMRDPQWEAEYHRERSRLQAMESILRRIDEQRAARQMTKAALARSIGAEPSVVRRLLNQEAANPTLGRVLDLADAVGLKFELTESR